MTTLGDILGHGQRAPGNVVPDPLNDGRWTFTFDTWSGTYAANTRDGAHSYATASEAKQAMRKFCSASDDTKPETNQ